jgi:hypothetical protein
MKNKTQRASNGNYYLRVDKSNYTRVENVQFFLYEVQILSFSQS